MSAAEHVARLRKQVERSNTHVLDARRISDAECDPLLGELQAVEPPHPELESRATMRNSSRIVPVDYEIPPFIIRVHR